MEAIPSIEAAGAIWRLPIAEGGAYQVLEIEGHEPAAGETDWVYWRPIAGDYFSAMGIRGLEGRGFDMGDTAHTEPVGVVNRRLAESYWPGESALGKRLKKLC